MSTVNVTFRIPDSAERQFLLWKTVSGHLENEKLVRNVKFSDAERILTMDQRPNFLQKWKHIGVRVDPESATACTITLSGQMMGLLMKGDINVILIELIRVMIKVLEEMKTPESYACAVAYANAVKQNF
jgi:hypothetical protein